MEKYFGNKSKEQLTTFEIVRLSNYKSRFNRWHDKQIDLLTFSINLVFTITIAIYGFIFNHNDHCFFIKLVCGFSMFKISIVFLTLSLVFGFIALIARLNDFRLTKNTIKYRRRIFELDNNIKFLSCKKNKIDEIKTNLKCSSSLSKVFGYITWISFYLQFTSLIILFIIISTNI
jgi:hypothetical protein